MRILEPQRGVRAEYLRLVAKNAEQNLKAYLARQEVQETAQARSPTDLADALELPGTAAPDRVLRHLQRREGPIQWRRWSSSWKAEREEQVPQVQDQYRSRPERLRDDAENAAPPPALPAPHHRRNRYAGRTRACKEVIQQAPDQLLIDGGKGQLSAVVEVMEELDAGGPSGCRLG